MNIGAGPAPDFPSMCAFLGCQLPGNPNLQRGDADSQPDAVLLAIGRLGELGPVLHRNQDP
jgi:hypothetical protein